MAQNEVRIVLKADDRASGKLKRTKASLGGLKIAAAAAGAAAAAAVAGLAMAAKKAIEAASRSQMIYAQYAVTLRNAVGLQEDGVRQAKAMVSALVRQTGYGDELLAQTADIYARQGFSVKRQEELVRLTAEVAAATGKDLLGAASAVNYVLTGQVGMLKRMGIIIDENVLKTKDTELILADLQRQMEGSAEVFASTWQGQLNIIQSQFMDIVEEAGRLIIQNEEVKEIFADIDILIREFAPIIRGILTETNLVSDAAGMVRHGFRGALIALETMAATEAQVVGIAGQLAAVWSNIVEVFAFIPGINADLARDLKQLSVSLTKGAENAQSWANAFGNIRAALDAKGGVVTPLKMASSEIEKIVGLAKEQGLTTADVTARLQEQGLTWDDLRAGNADAIALMRDFGAEVKATAAALGGAAPTPGDGTAAGGAAAVKAQLSEGMKPLQYWVSSARRMREDYEAMVVTVDKLSDTMEDAGDETEDAIDAAAASTRELVRFLDDAENAITGGVAEAMTQWMMEGQLEWKKWAGQMLRDIQRMIVKFLVLKAIKASLQIGTGGGGFLTGLLGFQRGGVVGRRHLKPLHAQGGLVVPGTGFGDKVPALLSPRELVLSRSVTSQLARSENVTNNVTNAPRIQVTVAGEGDPLRIQQAIREGLRAEQARQRELAV